MQSTRVRPGGGYEISGGGRGAALCSVSARGSGNQRAGEQHGGVWPQTRGLQTPSRTELLRGTCSCANPNMDSTVERGTSVTMVPRKKPCDCGGALRPETQPKLGGGDDGDGGDGAGRMRTPDLRTSSITELPQEISPWPNPSRFFRACCGAHGPAYPQSNGGERGATRTP